MMPSNKGDGRGEVKDPKNDGRLKENQGSRSGSGGNSRSGGSGGSSGGLRIARLPVVNWETFSSE